MDRVQVRQLTVIGPVSASREEFRECYDGAYELANAQSVLHACETTSIHARPQHAWQPRTPMQHLNIPFDINTICHIGHDPIQERGDRR